jgi:hypothetical protein
VNYPQQPGQYPHNWPPQQPQQQNWPPQQQPQQNWPPQQQPQQPQAWTPQPPQQQAAEGVAITTHFMPLSFMLALFKPKILIDGYEAPPAVWGRNVVAARPGQHRVHVHVPYFLPPQIGPADAFVDVYPGRLVELEYKAPVWGFSPGSLGAPPQSYNGVGITIALMVGILVFAFGFPLLMVLLSSL